MKYATAIWSGFNKAQFKLFESPWLHRDWIRQEVMVAKDITVVCGRDEVRGYLMKRSAARPSRIYTKMTKEDISGVAQLSNDRSTAISCLTRGWIYIRPVTQLTDSIRSIWYHHSGGLLNLFIVSREYKAAHSRDKLCSVLDLARVPMTTKTDIPRQDLGALPSGWHFKTSLGGLPGCGQVHDKCWYLLSIPSCWLTVMLLPTKTCRPVLQIGAYLFRIFPRCRIGISYPRRWRQVSSESSPCLSLMTRKYFAGSRTSCRYHLTNGWVLDKRGYHAQRSARLFRRWVLWRGPGLATWMKSLCWAIWSREAKKSMLYNSLWYMSSAYSYSL